MKKMTFVFALLLAATTAVTSSAQACGLCSVEKVALVDEVESIVQQIEFLNEEYQALKGVVSADDLATFQAYQQQKKQALIDLAIAKVQKI